MSAASSASHGRRFLRAFPVERAAVGTCASLLLATSASALDPDRTLAQIHHTAWTAEDGAPSQVSAIAQTKDGFLWIGSVRGLFRFDGDTFERYVRPDSLDMPSHSTYALLATPDGGLWISFRPSGLGFLQGGRLTTFFEASDAPTSQVYALALDHDEHVWAGAHDGLMLYDGSRWVRIGPDWNLEPSRVQSLLVDGEGTLWVAADNGLYSLARGARSFVRSGVQVGWIGNMAQGQDERLWLSEGSKLTVLESGGRSSAFRTTIAARQLLFDRDGCLWIAAPFEGGLRRAPFPARLASNDGSAHDPAIEVRREADGLSADAIHVLFEDREGSIWAGTAKGLDRFRHNHFVPVDLPASRQALTLLPDAGGDVWVGSAGGKPLIRVERHGFTEMDFPLQVSCVYRSASGIAWWGAVNQLVRQDQSTFRAYPQPTRNQEYIWEVFRSNEEGGLWASIGDEGLFHFKDGVWEKRTIAGLPDRGPSASYHAPDGRIWLGYTENRVCVLEGENVRAFTQSDGITAGRVRVIRGRGPHYWIGGELGLSMFKDGRFHAVSCLGAEPFGTVSGIVETADRGLWLNEMHGVVHIAPAEVARLVADPKHAVSLRTYDVLEGLPGAGQMAWTCATAVEGTDGRLWFATDGGVAWIDPARLRTNELPPPVVIRSIGTEDGAVDLSQSIRLPNDIATLQIDYTALSLVIPERVRFRYRLEGYDDEWVDAGTRRSAFYTRLHPGSYRFQVAASNNDGVWNTDGAAVDFSIAPAFYQTGWFAAACVAAVLGAVWLAYWLRIRQVASRLQRLYDERIDERIRIAHELHDTLLQGFLSASMQLHVATDAVAPDSPAEPQLRRVLGLMDNVIVDARDAVRGLRTGSSAAPIELEQAFTRIPQEVGLDGDVRFRVAVNGHSRPLQRTVRDEAYRIGRESLVNALRHASARTIETEIDYLPRELRLVVRDDGRGIDPDVLRTGRDGHWGLSGMRERAKRMGGRLTVRSRVGQGTEIELVVPGRIAFSGTHVSAWGRGHRWLRQHAFRNMPKEV